MSSPPAQTQIPPIENVLATVLIHDCVHMGRHWLKQTSTYLSVNCSEVIQRRMKRLHAVNFIFYFKTLLQFCCTFRWKLHPYATCLVPLV